MSEHIGKATIARATLPKTYRDVEVQRHSFLSSGLHEVTGQLHAPTAVTPVSI